MIVNIEKFGTSAIVTTGGEVAYLVHTDDCDYGTWLVTIREIRKGKLWTLLSSAPKFSYQSDALEAGILSVQMYVSVPKVEES